MYFLFYSFGAHGPGPAAAELVHLTAGDEWLFIASLYLSNLTVLPYPYIPQGRGNPRIGALGVVPV